MDVVFLSRLQFALTIMFHYIFPPLTIGLAGVIVVLKGQHLYTKKPIYDSAARFWTKLFAATFAMGVATGIVMEFQFGTNWATYSRFVGDVFGSALAAEGIFAFFLESGFLAILVFGWDRVGPRLHFLSAVMVAFGAMFSAVWIVVANSWQQTPAGHHIVGEGLSARAEIVDFWAMVFNPSSVIRLSHTLIGCYILGAFFVMSISAWYLLKRRHEEFALRSFRVAALFGLFFSVAAIVTGDIHAKVVAKYQPAKLAAFEGHFRSDGPAPLHIIGWPDEDAETVHFSLAIPGGLSFLVHRDFNAPVTGLDAFAPEDRPPVLIPFLSFHLMVAFGLSFLVLSIVGVWLSFKQRLKLRPWLLWVYVVWVLGAFATNQLGWIAAEVGRQPWVVYGLLRTADGVSKTVTAGEVLTSIILFCLIYTLLFFVWIYVLNTKIQRGPQASHPPGHTTAGGLLHAATALPSGEESLTTEPDLEGR